MPYIVKVMRAEVVESECAVETLVDARNAAADEINERPYSDDQNVMDELYDAAGSLPVSGGTIGPLPDGCVIEVQRVTWTKLVEPVAALGWVYPLVPHSDEERAEILAAYNAR